MSRYAFHFDSASCSGCKACQMACRDKHQLPETLEWRRIYEIEGGGWSRQGSAWVPDVYAYNISVGCNHCERPICVEGCPARAITARPDGIVLIDSDKCLGCEYCSWACPYGAPQYDATAGHMTKCTFCFESIDQGMPPACVAACPMRALDFGTLAEIHERHGSPATAYPMPGTELTEPALTMTPHRDAVKAGEERRRRAKKR